MKLSRWIGAGLGAAIVGSTIAFAAPAVADGDAPPLPAASTVPAAGRGGDLCLGQKVRLVWSKAPDELKAELEAARALEPGEERRAAFRQIRMDVLDGDYGAVARRFAEERLGAWVSAWRNAPAALKADLKALHAMEPGQERRDAATAIVDRALAGAYGDPAKARAERLQECRAER